MIAGRKNVCYFKTFNWYYKLITRLSDVVIPHNGINTGGHHISGHDWFTPISNLRELVADEIKWSF